MILTPTTSDKKIIRLEDLDELSKEHFNIIPQVRKGAELVRGSDEKALLFLKDLKGYSPMQLAYCSGSIYSLEPLVATHGVGSEVTRDSYTDLKGILNKGFESGIGIRNVFVQKANSVDFSKVQSWADVSCEPETFHDSYVILMEKMQVPRQDLCRIPRLIRDNTSLIHVSSANPKNIYPMIFLNPTLTHDEINKRIQFYTEDMPACNFKIIAREPKKLMGVGF